MKIILCTLLIVAVLSQQTRACTIPAVDGACHGHNFHFSYNSGGRMCNVHFENNMDYCAVKVSRSQCKESGMVFKHLPHTNECFVRKA